MVWRASAFIRDHSAGEQGDNVNLGMLLFMPASIAEEQIILIDTSTEVDGGTARAVTYSELLENVGKTAGLLTTLGVEVGDRVGIFATNSVECVEAIFGAAFVGATVVPMNFRAGAEEAAHLMSDSGIKVLFTESRYRELVEDNRPDSVDHVFMLDEDDSYPAARNDAFELPVPEDVDPDGLCALLYTSGTTSLPKGVKLTNGALTGYVMGTNDAATGEDMGRMALAAPLYHIAGVTSMLNALYSGRVVVLLPQFEASAWIDTIQKHAVTHAFLVPTMLGRVMEAPNFSMGAFSGMEAITYGAAPMPPSVIRRAIGEFPPNVSFAGAYGQTETTSTVAVLDPDDHRVDGSEEEQAIKLKRLSSVGQVLDDVEVRVVDEDGTPVASGVLGEVQLRTFRAMDGYWGNEEKTRITVDDEGWVHTGDLGYLDEDDYLFLGGRTGDMIIRGGENVSPDEVEAILYENNAVLECAVVGVASEEWGERVVAAAVVRSGSGVDGDDLVAFAKEKLAPFKRPEAVHLMDELPRTSTGKLLRRDLIPMLEDLGI
ncbi:MAG TPA: AMP-binding protein [Acidimicrobiales bacterium]|nr:AMP-binding protein [Acidimicrobiales bacterium]